MGDICNVNNIFELFITHSFTNSSCFADNMLGERPNLGVQNGVKLLMRSHLHFHTPAILQEISCTFQ